MLQYLLTSDLFVRVQARYEDETGRRGGGITHSPLVMVSVSRRNLPIIRLSAINP